MGTQSHQGRLDSVLLDVVSPGLPILGTKKVMKITVLVLANDSLPLLRLLRYIFQLF